MNEDIIWRNDRAGHACGLHPYRGAASRTLSKTPNVRSVRNVSRTLAHSIESKVSEACGSASVRADFSVRVSVRSKARPHTEKQSVKGASDRHQKSNLESARVILENLAKYGGEEAALVEWARAVVRKYKPGIDGPLFRRTV